MLCRLSRSSFRIGRWRSRAAGSGRWALRVLFLGALSALCLSVLGSSAGARASGDNAPGSRAPDQAAGASAPAARIQALLERADALARDGELQQAESAVTRALEISESADPRSRTTALCLERLARLAYERETAGEEPEAMARRAVSLLEETAPGSLDLARALTLLSRFETNLTEATDLAERALRIEQAVAPEGMEMAETLSRLQALRQGPEALESARRALAIRRRLAPSSSETAQALANVARQLREEGDLDGADARLDEALALQQRIDPKSQEMASLLGSLAVLDMLRGDLREAEAHNLQALAIEEVTAGPVTRARRLNNLARLASIRGDLDSADRYLARGLRLLGEDDPSDLHAASLAILADVALARGQVERALAIYDRADAILRAIDPGHPGVGYVASKKARILLDAGRPEEARTLLLPAVEEARRDFPGTPGLADRLFLLAEADRLRGDRAAALRLHREALGIRETLAPGSLDEAESAHALGVLARDAGDPQQALALFRRAVAALERQSERLGGSPEARARFRGRYRALYRDLERLLLGLGRRDEAFHVLEEVRGQGLLALMASRHLDLDANLPDDLAEQIRAADSAYDRALHQLATRGPTADPAGLEELRGTLDRARQRRLEVRDRRRAVLPPRTAPFREARALRIADVQALLEPGTLMLSYSLGPERSVVYTLGPGREGLGVADLGLDQDVIRSRVKLFRGLISAPPTPRRRLAAVAAATELGRLLLGPVADRLEHAERLLVVPDGALNVLPFAALVVPGAPADEPQYLVQSLPSQVVSSMTLYASLRQSKRGGSAPRRVVGFGDPSYPVTASAGGTTTTKPASTSWAKAPVLRGALESGLDLTPLASSRSELEALRRVFPGRAETWTGKDASEARVMSAAPGASVLHLACHGFVDERFPMESGLALAIDPGHRDAEDNGLLQAWEIFEHLRLDADLVTLSACDTGLGQEDAGEGLLGLTWAFLYAGADSVLASLWSVSDASTAALMARFYRELSAGAPEAEALRRAQLALLDDPATRSPFYWAPFHLVGAGD